MVDNSRRVGQYLHDRLEKISEEFPEVADVRGRGLLQGFELEGDDKWAFGQRLYETMLANGLVTELESRRNLGNVVVVLHPALTITESEADQAAEIIRESLMKCR